jgi:ribose transport system substrate-binding protein
VAACGSSSSSSSSSSSGATSNATVSLATFQSKLAAAEAPVTKWGGPSTPVTPPKSFKVAGVTCYSILHGCDSPILGAQDAAKALGWSFTIYDGKDDPSVQSADIEQAVASGANAIITSAVNGATVKSALALAKSKGVIVVSTSNGSAPGQQGFMLDTSPNLTQLGAGIADWAIVTSGGKGPFVPFLDPEFQSNIATEDGMQTELKLCTSCKVEPTQKFVATDVGTTLPGNTVAYFHANPSVKFFYGSYDPAMVGQVTALKQAGLSDIQGCSILGDAQNIQFIRTGEIQTCDGAWDNEYEGYATIDQIIRLATHKPLAVSTDVPAAFKYGENIPYTVLVKSNIPAAGQDWHASYDYISCYKKLWGLEKGPLCTG